VILLGLLAAHPPIGAAVAVGDGPTELPRPSVVILWGSWCVPCRAELQRIPSLRRFAQPLPIVILAMDPPDVAGRALAQFGVPATSAFADARPPATVLADWGGKGALLPLAVAIDRRGAICGLKRGLLGTDQLRQWAARCLK
jgi:thiol-disulfide isomerase/thioredoxin